MYPDDSRPFKQKDEGGICKQTSQHQTPYFLEEGVCKLNPVSDDPPSLFQHHTLIASIDPNPPIIEAVPLIVKIELTAPIHIIITK